METAESIRLRMQSTRANLQPELTQVVQDAQTLMNWKFYLQRFPLASVGLAIAAGYLLVPFKYEVRHPRPKDLEKLAHKRKVVIDADPTPARQAGMMGAVGGLLLNLAFKAGMAYFGQQVRERLDAHIPSLGKSHSKASHPHERSQPVSKSTGGGSR